MELTTAIVQYQSKFKQLLEKFLSVKYHPSKFDASFDKLLKSLSKTESSLISLPVFTEWIKGTVSMWAAEKITPPTNLASFTLNLASLLSTDEERFAILNTNNFFIKLVFVIKVKQVNVEPSLGLAYIRLLSSFLEHRSGIEWMMTCNFWEDIFQSCLTLQNVKIAKESHRLLAKFLEKIIDYDEEFCVSVVKKMMLPLGEDVYRSIKSRHHSMADISFQNLSSLLRLLCDILEYLMKGILVDNKDFRVLLIFWKNFSLEERISEFALMAQNKCLTVDLTKFMFIMQFLELYVNVTKNNLSPVTVVSSAEAILYNYVLNLSKDVDIFLNLTSFSVIYCNLIATKVLNFLPDKSNKAKASAYELSLMQLTPTFYLTMKYCFINDSQLEELLLSDIFRDLFFDKIFKLLSEAVFRLCYTWRDYMMAHENLFELSSKQLLYALDNKKCYSKESAVLVFQTLIYTLKDFIEVIKDSPEKTEIVIKEFHHFSLMFEALAIFIEEFDITWKEGVEVIDVMAVSFDFLSLSSWFSDGVVRIMKLIDISITKYMTPNLALLVDRTSDSTIALLGPILYSKMHDEVGEIRKVALEVVHTLAKSSRKFPSLQKVLMDSDLPTLVVKMSICDGESFVRATAIKCLQEMIQVEDIWNNSLISENLTEKMRNILLNETEGIVRVEAATFMCIAYEHQQFPRDSLEAIYDTMIHASTTDLHWEVKIRALDFWDKVIKDHLQNQGMIDGAFPNVTFSKEHRKIVTLTDSEIRKRLHKVLNQLSTVGCLGVLMSAIKDDYDMEVSKAAVKITRNLQDLFKKYNMFAESSSPTSPTPTENSLLSSSGMSMNDIMESPRSHSSKEIIDRIVNSKVDYLLNEIFPSSDYETVSNFELNVKKILNPGEFLQYLNQDLNNVLAEKRNWINRIEDLGSFLDDMLKICSNDENNMDCY